MDLLVRELKKPLWRLEEGESFHTVIGTKDEGYYEKLCGMLAELSSAFARRVVATPPNCRSTIPSPQLSSATWRHRPRAAARLRARRPAAGPAPPRRARQPGRRRAASVARTSAPGYGPAACPSPIAWPAD